MEESGRINLKWVQGVVLLLGMVTVVWAGEPLQKEEAPGQKPVIQELSSAQKELESAITQAKQAVEDHPTAESWDFLGTLFCQGRRYEEGLKAYDQALALNPRLASAHNHKGNAYLSKGDAQAAIQCYRSAVEANPKFAEAYANLGMTYYRIKKLDEAIQAYRKAADLMPQYADAFCNLGTAYHENGDDQNAMRAFQRAIEINPQHSVAHLNLGTAYFDLRRYPEAIQEWGMIKDQLGEIWAKRVEKLIEEARLKREGIGLSVELGFVWKSEPRKLIVLAIESSSPAAEGKFKKGDVILQVEGIKISNSKGFDEQLFKFAEGQKLKIRVERQGRQKILWLALTPGSGVLSQGRLRELGEAYLDRERAGSGGEAAFQFQYVDRPKLDTSLKENRLTVRLTCAQRPVGPGKRWTLVMNPWTGEVLSRQVSGE